MIGAESGRSTEVLGLNASHRRHEQAEVDKCSTFT
jgi:hypothetical protein